MASVSEDGTGDTAMLGNQLVICHWTESLSQVLGLHPLDAFRVYGGKLAYFFLSLWDRGRVPAPRNSKKEKCDKDSEDLGTIYSAYAESYIDLAYSG